MPGIFGRDRLDPHQRIVDIFSLAASGQRHFIRPVPGIGVDGDGAGTRYLQSGKLVVIIVGIRISNRIGSGEGLFQAVFIVGVAVGQIERPVVYCLGQLAV